MKINPHHPNPESAMPGQKAPEDERRAAILRAAFAVAARERLSGLTVQQVAREAGVSKGLVFFYFETKDALVLALLDSVIERVIPGEIHAHAEPALPAAERLVAVIRQVLEWLPRQRDRVELFFDYWSAGVRHPEVRQRIRAALQRSQPPYRPYAEAVIAADPQRFRGVTADALAALVLRFIEGCALQAVLDPEHFDVDGYVRAARALVAGARDA